MTDPRGSMSLSWAPCLSAKTNHQNEWFCNHLLFQYNLHVLLVCLNFYMCAIFYSNLLGSVNSYALIQCTFLLLSFFSHGDIELIILFFIYISKIIHFGCELGAPLKMHLFGRRSRSSTFSRPTHPSRQVRWGCAWFSLCCLRHPTACPAENSGFLYSLSTPQIGPFVPVLNINIARLCVTLGLLLVFFLFLFKEIRDDAFHDSSNEFWGEEYVFPYGVLEREADVKKLDPFQRLLFPFPLSSPSLFWHIIQGKDKYFIKELWKSTRL